MNTSPWKTRSTRYLYEDKWTKLRQDEVTRPDGSAGKYLVVEREHFVLVIPKIGEKYYLVDQFRYPVNKRSLEFPQGSREANEEPLTGAKRELLEETGLTAAKISKIGFLYLANGNNTQGYYIYLAENCAQGSKKLDKTEADLKTMVLSWAEIKTKIASGEITDSPTVAAFGLVESQKN